LKLIMKKLLGDVTGPASSSRRRSLRIGVGVAAVLGLVAAAIPALAAVTATTPVTYYACVTNKTGALKVVSATAKCATGQHKISWNSLGPRGPVGPRGPQGPRGVAGPAGVVNSHIFQSSSFVALNSSSDTVVATLTLPAGDFQVSADVGLDLVNTSTPDTASCSMLDGGNNVLDDQYTSYALEGELTLLGDTTVGGRIEVQCFDEGDNADATYRTIQAIPVTRVVAAGALHARFTHLSPRLGLPKGSGKVTSFPAR
jgi:hypothetical protein